MLDVLKQRPPKRDGRRHDRRRDSDPLGRFIVAPPFTTKRRFFEEQAVPRAVQRLVIATAAAALVLIVAWVATH